MNAPQDGIPDWKVAVISITPRSSDPGAINQRVVSLVVSAIHLALIHLLIALMVGSPALMVGSDNSHTVRSCLTWTPSSAGLVWITV